MSVVTHYNFKYFLFPFGLCKEEVSITQEQLAGPGSLLFQPDMKLEAKDRQNPHLICVATIANIKDGKLLIHFDGWTSRSSFHIKCVFK